MFVQYSPLCDTSEAAYFKYLAVQTLFLDGGWKELQGSGGVFSAGAGWRLVAGDSGDLGSDRELCDGSGDDGAVRSGGSVEGVVLVSGDREGCVSRANFDKASVVGERVGAVNANVGEDGFSRGAIDGDHGSGCRVRDASVGQASKGVLSSDGVELNSVGRKKKMGKNQRDRAKYGKFGVNWRGPVESGVSCDVKTKARESLEKKWEVENRVAIAKAELAEEKAKKDLEFQRARDVDAEIKRSRTLVMKQTESNKVATEKAFASLKATGNVSGFCETVVSDGGSVPGLSGGSSSAEGCTISPDSSASMHEFRKCQKELEDLKFENKRLARQLQFGKLAAGEEATFTVYSDGDVSKGVRDEINKHITDWHDVDERDDAYGDDRAYTLFVKKVSVPSADEYAFDLIGQ